MRSVFGVKSGLLAFLQNLCFLSGRVEGSAWYSGCKRCFEKKINGYRLGVPTVQD